MWILILGWRYSPALSFKNKEFVVRGIGYKTGVFFNMLIGKGNTSKKRFFLDMVSGSTVVLNRIIGYNFLCTYVNQLIQM
jgi:hypothetical protein